MPAADLITAEEAAAILGCSGRTVRRKAAAGHLTPIRKLPGDTGAWLYLRADVMRLAADQAEASA